MLDEEKNRSVFGSEDPGGVRWDGPHNRRPQALGASAGSDAPGYTGGTMPTPKTEGTMPAQNEEPGSGGATDDPPEETPTAQKTDAGETARLIKPTGSGKKPAAHAKKANAKSATKKGAAKKRAPARGKRTIPVKKPKKVPVPKPQDLDPWEQERDYLPIRTRRDGRLGCLGGLMYATFMISLSVVLAVFLWMSAADVLALNKTEGEVEVTLPQEIFYDKEVDVKDEEGNVTGTETVKVADIKTVASLLKDAGVINYKWLFSLYSTFSNAERKLDPGTYTLATNLDYRALVTKMQTGADSQLQTLVMFPEGFNLDQIFARLEENGVCSTEELYEAAANAEYSYAFLEDVETGDPYRLEGFLFPDTYYFYEGMQASSAINRFLSNFHYRITDEMWQRADALGLTFKQAITVASIIEREAANDDERALIASVLYNRLKLGMPLQVDCTIVYALRDTGEVRVSPEIIQALDSPYNTYLNTGLPPGPICNPGMKSIEAALNPEDSTYLYFALDAENGVVRFFNTLAEHEAFVATQNYG